MVLTGSCSQPVSEKRAFDFLTEGEMLRRGRFLAGVLIGTATGLWTGAAFSQNNREPLAARAGEAPQVQPSQIPYAQPANVRSAGPPMAGEGSRIKTIAPQLRTAAQASQSTGQLPMPSDRENRPDPLAPINHKILNLNVKVDRTAFHPIAGGWSHAVPQPARKCIDRFFDNVGFIPRFTNAVFQLKLRNAGGELARFGINSTVGVAGLFDPAAKWFGIKEHDNDFGRTLATWGMSDGWLVVMPIGGPVDVRNALGHFGDGAMNPMNYLVPGSAEVYEMIGHSIEGLNKRANDLDKFEGVPMSAPAALDSPNLYETVRTNYLHEQTQKKADNAAGIGASTAGAAAAAGSVVGSRQSQAAAIGTATDQAAPLGR
jgi:phospholipid-binding lipoprotein MlaA